jgi:zinc transporter ZupT
LHNIPEGLAVGVSFGAAAILGFAVMMVLDVALG